MTGAQQLMCCCHRANASLKCRSEFSDRSVPLPGVGDDSSDGRQRVFDAVVEFGIQEFAGLFGAFTLGDVDIDAHHPFRTPIFTVRDSTASLDPSDLAV